MGAGTIAEISQSCRINFNSLLDVYSERQRDDLSEIAQLLGAIEDEQARLNTWAAHIGVFARHHSSLDYRLRESERVQSLVISQLKILRAAQTRMLNILRPDAPALNRIEPIHLKQRHDSASPTASEISDDSDSAHSDERTREDALESMRNAIDRLHRLARQIRQPGLISHASKANNFKPLDEYGNGVIEVFEYANLQIIKAKANSTPDFLVQRLSRANASRRRLFLYRRKHQEYLNGKAQKSFKCPSITRQETEGSGPVALETQPSVLPIRSTPAMSSATMESRVQSSVAKATSFVESAFQADRSSRAASSFAGTSVASSLLKARLPPPPKDKEVDNEFECPYCCQLVSMQMLERKYWRQHLIKDLEPYVCVFENCPQADTRYRDQSTWMNHLRSHAVRWVCRFPGHAQGESTLSFDSAEAHAHNLSTQHLTGKALQQAQIKQLLKLQRPIQDPAPLKVCPFCPTTLDDFRPSPDTSSNRHIGGAISLPAAALKMQKHIASHLMALASYCLPWLDDVEGDVASDRAPSVTTDSDLTDLDEESVSKETKSASVLTEDTEDLVFEDQDVISERIDTSEWSFVPDVSYQGQEFDDKLSAFVRKYNIEMALAEETIVEPKFPCVHIPLDQNSEFFNRESELKFLDDHFCGDTSFSDDEGHTEVQPYSLYGAGGIGKTEVAVEWTYRNLHKFDAVFWIHADEASKMSEDVNRIALQLGLVDEKSADSGDQSLTRELLRRWLGDPVKSFRAPSSMEKAKWLLVLDHVIDPQILDDFWPSTRHYGSILVTSRRPMPWDQSKYSWMTIEPFESQEGAALMCNLVPYAVSEEERECAHLISSKVKGRPYALVHLTKWILEEGLSFAQIMSHDNARGKSKLQMKMKSKLAIFAVDEDHLFLETVFKSIAQYRPLLDVLSMLDPDSIPRRLLLMDNSQLSIPGYPTTRSTLNDGLDELLKPFPDFTWRHGTSRWPQCEELFPHIMRLRRIAPSIEANEYDLYCGFQYARLWCDCAWYCHERGRTGEADVFSALAQNVCDELKKQFTPMSHHDPGMPTERAINDILAEIMYNRGVIAVEAHKPVESLDHLLNFNAMMIKELRDRKGGTDMRLALSFNELGCAYLLSEDYPRAEECFNNSITRKQPFFAYEEHAAFFE